jgi:hypothetical protein
MSKLYSVYKKLIGIKKDIFYGLPVATSCSRGKSSYCTYPVEFGVTAISKEISPTSSLGEISILSPFTKRDNSPHVTAVWTDMNGKWNVVLDKFL